MTAGGDRGRRDKGGGVRRVGEPTQAVTAGGGVNRREEGGNHCPRADGLRFGQGRKGGVCVIINIMWTRTPEARMVARHRTSSALSATAECPALASPQLTAKSKRPHIAVKTGPVKPSPAH